MASSRRSSPIKPGKALEGVDQVGHPDLDGRAGDADGWHDQRHPVLLPGRGRLPVLGRARLLERGVEASKELVDCLGCYEPLPKQPDRRRSGTVPSNPSLRNRWNDSRSLI